MIKENFTKELGYQTTMYLARRMLEQGLISKEEYVVIDTIFLSKYEPTLGTLFSELT